MMVRPQGSYLDCSSRTLQRPPVFGKGGYDQRRSLRALRSQPKINQFRSAIARQDFIGRYAQLIGYALRKPRWNLFRINRSFVQTFSKHGNGNWRPSEWADVGAET